MVSIIHRIRRRIIRHTLGDFGYALSLVKRYCVLSRDPYCNFSLTFQTIWPIRLFDSNYSIDWDSKWCARLHFNYRPAIEARHEDPHMAILMLLRALPELSEEPAPKV